MIGQSDARMRRPSSRLRGIPHDPLGARSRRRRAENGMYSFAIIVAEVAVAVSSEEHHHLQRVGQTSGDLPQDSGIAQKDEAPCRPAVPARSVPATDHSTIRTSTSHRRHDV